MPGLEIPHPSTPILIVKDLSVKIDGEKILRHLNFQVEERETLVILGPNGAGKTMLLKVLLGLLPFRGEVIWKTGVRKGYVPQRVPYHKQTPINVEEFFSLKHVSRPKTLELLAQVGITENSFLRRRIGEISSGQFQRVLIAWALAGNPNVLLFDEPTAGIDVGGEETIYSLLQRIQVERNLAIILVTHELTTVYQQADNVLCLNKKLICHGPPQTILTPKNLQKVFGEKTQYFQHHHG